MSWKDEWLKPTWLVTMACAMLGVWQASLGRRESHEAKQDAKSAVDGVLTVSDDQAAIADSVRALYADTRRLGGRVTRVESDVRLLKVAAGRSSGEQRTARTSGEHKRGTVVGTASSPKPWWKFWGK